MRNEVRCPNMNHGRSNGRVKFCPTCGEFLKSSAGSPCDEAKHAVRRKERSAFCHDCGKKLAGT